MINADISRNDVIRSQTYLQPPQDYKHLPAFLTMIVAVPLLLFLVWTQSALFAEARFLLSDYSAVNATVIDKEVKNRVLPNGNIENVYRIYLSFMADDQLTYASYYDSTESVFNQVALGSSEEIIYANQLPDINGRYQEVSSLASPLSLLQKLSLPALTLVLSLMVLIYYPVK